MRFSFVKTYLVEFYVFKIIKFPKCGLLFLQCSDRERGTVSLDEERWERDGKGGRGEGEGEMKGVGIDKLRGILILILRIIHSTAYSALKSCICHEQQILN